MFISQYQSIDRRSAKKIAFCDSLENLQQYGFFLQEWVESPMLLERGFIECEAMTPRGKMRCMLDTGATKNVLHREGTQGIDEAFWDPNNKVNFPWFTINGHPMGAMIFHSGPIRLPVQVEAILGMDFFLEHVVFLDFANERIIFAKSSF